MIILYYNLKIVGFIFLIRKYYIFFLGGIICIVVCMEGFYKFEEYKDLFFLFCDKLEKDGKW